MAFRNLGRINKKFLASTSARFVRLGIYEDADQWIGKRIFFIPFFSLLISLGAYLVTKTLLIAAGMFVAALLFLTFLQYVSLFFKQVSRTEQVEKVLPEFLTITASNLRAGMTPYDAFMRANREEFKGLYYEIHSVGAMVSARTSLVEVLRMLEGRFDSVVFKRSIDLFSKASRSGGQLAKLLLANAEEIRRIRELKQELVMQTQSYTIFLAFIVIIVMPFLLAVSVSFLNLFSSIQEQSGISSIGSISKSVPIFAGKLPVTVEEMRFAAIISLIITALLSSILNGVISTGKPLYGLKYFPLVAAFALAAFWFALLVVGSMVSIT